MKASLTIIDNGIGMNKDELQKYICDLPEHRLKHYSETINTYDTTSPDVDLSCFFSNDSYAPSTLGFHSAYMVADKVVVTTKTTGGSQYVWTGGVDSCTIVEDTSGETDLGRGGTKVTLLLNQKHRKYVDDECVFNNLINKCAQHSAYPLYMISVDDQKKKIKREIFYDEKKQREERAIPLETLKAKYEGLRRKFQEILGRMVDKVIVSDRVPEFANNLSQNRKIFEINPRSPITEKMREMLEDHEEMKHVVELHYEAS